MRGDAKSWDTPLHTENTHRVAQVRADSYSTVVPFYASYRSSHRPESRGICSCLAELAVTDVRRSGGIRPSHRGWSLEGINNGQVCNVHHQALVAVDKASHP